MALLILQTSGGSSRVIHGVTQCRFMDFDSGKVFGWFREGHPFGFALTLAHIEKRYTRIALINEKTTMGMMPLFIFENGYWRI